MYKFLALCLFALFACAAAKPQWLVPGAYTAPVAAVAAPSVAVAGVDPYYATYAAAPWWSSYAAYPYASSYWWRR